MIREKLKVIIGVQIHNKSLVKNPKRANALEIAVAMFTLQLATRRGPGMQKGGRGWSLQNLVVVVSG